MNAARESFGKTSSWHQADISSRLCSDGNCTASHRTHIYRIKFSLACSASGTAGRYTSLATSEFLCNRRLPQIVERLLLLGGSSRVKRNDGGSLDISEGSVCKIATPDIQNVIC